MAIPAIVGGLAAGAGLLGSLFGGSNRPPPITTTTSGYNVEQLDPASMQYISQFLRPQAREAAGVLTSAPRLPGVDPATNQAIARLSQAYAGPGQVDASAIGALPTLAGALASGDYDMGGSFRTSFGAGGAGGGYDPRQLDVSRIQEFFNPYQDEVIGGLQGDFDRIRGVTSRNAAQQATREGAFGGSRSAILEAQGLRDVAQQEGNTLGQFRYQGYEAARDAALREHLQGEAGRAQVGAAGAGASGTIGAAAINASQRAQDALAQLRLNAAQSDIGNELTRRLQNQQFGLDRYQLESGANQAANTLDLNRLNSLAASGAQRRDAAVQANQDYLNRWIQAVNVGATGLGPTGTSTNRRTTQTQTQPGTRTNPWEALLGGGLTLLGSAR